MSNLLFEVIGPDGKCKMHTEHESCIPYEHIDSMASAGYHFWLDNKKVSKYQLLKQNAISPKSQGRIFEKSTKFVIKCVETNKQYPNQSSAARDLGIDPAQVSDSIKTGRKRSGYTFVKEEIDDNS